MKGKKFNAAEKHFLQKEVKIRQELREMKEWYEDICNVNSQLVEENNALRHELSELLDRYNKALEYSKLSESQILNAIKKDNSIVSLTEILSTMRAMI